ncbi:MAG: hypothetical protein JW750_04030, partial [Anaerolineaceae bacterium]|nr:hypothetical protein [Anaerolineaceae bacterium]
MEKISLNGSGWLFKDFTNDDWRWRHSVEPDTLDHRWWREGSVPGSPQHDLFQLGVIPNPYFELNSLAVEWIPQRSWVYKRTFMAEERWLGQRVNLHFEGVDYEAHFYLNGKLLGSHVGMYTPIDFDLTHDLEYGKENLLAVVIEHAPDEQSQVGFTSKVRTHKSRMTYWWDFCPRVVHLGIWDDVSLEITGAVKLGELFARPTLADDFRKADVRVAVPFHSRQATTVRVETAIRIDGEVVAAQESMM